MSGTTVSSVCNLGEVSAGVHNLDDILDAPLSETIEARGLPCKKKKRFFDDDC